MTTYPSTKLVPLLLATLLYLQARPASGHGMMCTPRQRGAYRSIKCGSDLPFPSDPVTDHCAHCLNGGTVATVKEHLPPSGWHVYEPVKHFDLSARRAGLCGDAATHHAHMIGGDFLPLSFGHVPIVDVWKSGDTVDFLAEIDTNHNGYFEFFLCDLDACAASDISGKCFRNGHCHKLLRIPHTDCEDASQNTHYECGPIDDRYPGRWYLPCRNTGHVGVHIVGGPSGTMRYQLPKRVTCKHCVLQWYWATANSCAPRGLLAYMARMNNPFGTKCESDGGGRGTYRPGMVTCGGDNVPEEFWSCADVQITRDGKPGGQVVLKKGEWDLPDEPESVDGAEVKENPEEVFDKVQSELEKDIADEATESGKEENREEKKAAAGACLLEGDRCDGTVPCCDPQQVCVFGIKQVGFSCRFWWSLWDEVETREKEIRTMKESSK